MIWVFACFILCFKYWSLAGHTYLRDPKLCHDLLELLSLLHLNFYELWTCSNASLISFWAWCALLFLKKNALLIHLDLFESSNILKKLSLASLKSIWEKEILCSWPSLISFWSSLSFTLVLHLYPMSKLLSKFNVMNLKSYHA